MRAALLIAASACALAACGSKTGSTTVTTNAQTGEVATSTTGGGAQPMRMTPGEWETRITITDLKMANVPGASSAPSTITAKTCITPEQAARGPGDFIKQAKLDCTATTSNYAGGSIAAEMTCRMPGGQGEMHSRTTGTYTATSVTTDAEVTMTGAVATSQKIHSEGKRIGACPAGT